MYFLEHPVQVKNVGIQFDDKSENVASYVWQAISVVKSDLANSPK